MPSIVVDLFTEQMSFSRNLLSQNNNIVLMLSLLSSTLSATAHEN
tara:strand:- start:130 stop:264 length:135 start_codon:yes stop_codon:yes gene_type:complete